MGDATDAASVRAMDGRDAVVYAAAIFSYDARDAAPWSRGKARATKAVLGAVRAGGLDPTYVSSYVALLPPAGVLADALRRHA